MFDFIKNSSVVRKLSFVGAALFIMFSAALSVSVYNSYRSAAQFNRFIDEDESDINSLYEMYGYGLLSGQAARNFILNPSDPVPLKTMNSAKTKFENALRAEKKQPIRLRIHSKTLEKRRYGKIRSSRTRQNRQARRSRPTP